MPISYHIDPQLPIVVARALEALTLPDIIDFRSQCAADPQIGREFGLCLDLRQAERILLRATEIRELGGYRRSHPPGEYCMAILATRMDMIGMARMYQVSRADEAVEVRVFTNPDIAMMWVRERAQATPRRL